MKDQKYLLPVVVVVVILLGGFILIKNNTQKQVNNNMAEPDYESGIQITAPVEVIDEETGEIDQAAFEESQKLSEDNSLDTLEMELNNTVILEEDFTNL